MVECAKSVVFNIRPEVIKPHFGGRVDPHGGLHFSHKLRHDTLTVGSGGLGTTSSDDEQ